MTGGQSDVCRDCDVTRPFPANHQSGRGRTLSSTWRGSARPSSVTAGGPNPAWDLAGRKPGPERGIPARPDSGAGIA